MQIAAVAFRAMVSRLSPVGAPRCALRVLSACAGLALMGATLGGPAPAHGDGIYTREQADRGRMLYDVTCADCHGSKLEGGTSTPLAGSEFIASWGRPNLTLDDFYYIVRKTMPREKPGSLTREAYADIVAYILQQNSFPPGEKELTSNPDLMKTVRFGGAVPPAAQVAPFTPR